MADKEVATIMARPDVYQFSLAMEVVLAAHDEDRGERGWINSSCSVRWFVDRLREEAEELSEAMNNADPDNVQKECVDVANFAMMIFTILEERDNARIMRSSYDD